MAYNAGQVPVYYGHPWGSGWHQSESIGFPDYVDCPHRPRYHFGFGLSYTSFAYADLEISREEVPAGESVEIAFTVENTGPVPGDEVAQLYISDAVSYTHLDVYKRQLWRKAGYGKNAGEMSGRRAGETASHPFNGFYHPRQGGSGLSPPFRFSPAGTVFSAPAATAGGCIRSSHRIKNRCPIKNVTRCV